MTKTKTKTTKTKKKTTSLKKLKVKPVKATPKIEEVPPIVYYHEERGIKEVGVDQYYMHKTYDLYPTELSLLVAGQIPEYQGWTIL